MATQELSTEVRQQSGNIAAYRDIDGMMKFVETFGKEFASMGLCGVQKQSEGRVLALACFLKRTDPFTLDDNYHVIGGKLSMKPDSMLASLRDQGGDYEWINDGSVEDKDGKMTGVATIKTMWRGKEQTTSYSMVDAYRAGLVKPKSGWDKNPDAMLRARVVTKAGRMHFPEVLKGKYAPEELDENYVEDEIRGEVVVDEPVRTKAEVEARAAEIRGEVEPEEPAVSQEPEDDIIDAEVEVASVSEPAEDSSHDPMAGFDQAMMDLDELLKKAKLSKERFELMLKSKEEYNWFKSLEECTADQIRRIADRLEKRLRGE